VTAVNDGNGTGYIYINGVLVVAGPQLVPASVVRTQEYVARSNYAGDAFFSGSIEDLHIWNSARSASQIHSDMNQSLGTSRDSTARIWKAPRPVQRTPEHILLWCEAHTGLTLDERGDVRVLDAKTWLEHANASKNSAPRRRIDASG
jgi:hypothetical protein